MPFFCRYTQGELGVDPVIDQLRVTCLSPGSTVSVVVVGVAVTHSVSVPSPPPFTARILKLYSEPLSKLLTVCLTVLAPAPVMTAQLAVLLVPVLL